MKNATLEVKELLYRELWGSDDGRVRCNDRITLNTWSDYGNVKGIIRNKRRDKLDSRVVFYGHEKKWKDGIGKRVEISECDVERR